MNKLIKVAIAYIMASFASLTTGWVIALVWSEWTHTRVTSWLFMAVIWLVIVGVPSLFAASNYLLKLLGVKDQPWIGLNQSRLVPVGAGSSFAYTLPQSPTLAGSNHLPRSVEMGDLEIRVGEYVISEPVLVNFLRKAWTRQKSNKDGLSRRWWVDTGKQLERGEYEAIVTVLTQAGIVQGRRPGRSGKLMMPPIMAITHLGQRFA